MKRVIVCISMIILFNGYVYADVPRGARPKEDPEILATRNRVVLINEWMSSGDFIVQETKDSKAREIMDFLWQRGVIGIQTPEGFHQVILKEKIIPVEKRILFVATKREDENLNSYFNFIWGLGLEVFYDFKNGIMGGKSLNEISRKWLGIILMRVGYQALLFNKTQYNWRDFHKFCEKELEARIFQHQIMEKLGRNEYKEYVKSRARLMRLMIYQEGKQVGKDYPFLLDYDTVLDKVFGPAKSEFERWSRLDSIWFHTCFELIDEEFKNKAKEQKVIFIGAIYKARGWIK